MPGVTCGVQFLAERDRERLRTQELLWREASLGSARQSAGEPSGADGSKDRTFHTLIPQFCAFCGQPIVQCIEVGLAGLETECTCDTRVWCACTFGRAGGQERACGERACERAGGRTGFMFVHQREGDDVDVWLPKGGVS